jgi:hypothetical protein
MSRADDCAAYLMSKSPIDRALQLELLLLLRDAYPRTLIEIPEISSADQESIFTNLWYLQAHGLCDSGLIPSLDAGFSWSGATLTAAGLDFLEADGGLSAILNVVTIKFDTHTLRALLEAKIEASSIPAIEKSSLKKITAALSDTALKSATTDLVHTGLQHIPNVVEWLQKFSGL